MRIRMLALLAVALLSLNGCASLRQTDPLQVMVAGIEPLPGAGFELRMMVTLRVQNPNETSIDYSGVYLKLDVQDQTFATGVSEQQGAIPGFSEATIKVPVTVSALRMARQVIGVLDGKPADQIRYDMTGKFGGSGFGSMRFKSQGEFRLPTGAQ